MKVEQFLVGSIGTNAYLMVQEETKECLAVDLGGCPDSLIDHIKEKGYLPKAILLTHGHFDHIMGVEKFRNAFGGDELPVYAYEKEKTMLEDPLLNMSSYYGEGCTLKQVNYVKDREELHLAGFTIQVIYTPGHTVGGCCYYFPEEQVLLSGDTLFCESVGRSDFPTGNAGQLVRSIKDRLLDLPEETKVYPGHMDETTIGHEKEYNPFL